MQQSLVKMEPETETIFLEKETSPFLDKISPADISLDDLWGNFERHLDDIGGAQLSEDTKDALFQGLVTGYQVFRPEGKRLKSKIASFNIRVGYIAYSVIERMRAEHGKRDKIISDWLDAYAKACNVSRASVFRFKALVKEFKTYKFADGRSFMDFLQEDSLEAITEFFDDYFTRNPDASMKALYEWATGSVTKEVHDYVHTLFSTKTTISLDRVKELQERAAGKRLSKSEEKPLPLPAQTEIEVEATHVQPDLFDEPAVPVSETPTYSPVPKKVEQAPEEKPFYLGTEAPLQSTVVQTPVEAAVVDTLKSRLEKLEDERAVLERQVSILETECDRLEKALKEKRSQEGVSREMLIDWVQNLNDYYFFQRVAVQYLMMAKTIADLRNPVTNKPYDKETLKRVVLAQLTGVSE